MTPIAPSVTEARPVPDGVRYARIAGILFGVFLLYRSVFGMKQWEGHGHESLVHAQAAFFAVYGVVLLLPWKRLGATRAWKYLFTLVCLLCVLFAFVMVIEVMALNYIAAAAHVKARPPAFQGTLLFAALGQIPTLLFLRRPELLD